MIWDKYMTLTKEERDFASQYMRETRQQLLNAACGLSDAQMRYKARPERWSIAEIIEHLINAENAVFALVTQQVMKSPAPTELRALVKERIMKSPVPFDGEGTDGLIIKDQAVMLSTTNRSVRRFQAPEAVKPRGHWISKADLLKGFEESRERTIAYIETTADELRNFLADNWVIGVMDAYQWLLFLTAHSERHIAQIKEVKSNPNFPAI